MKRNTFILKCFLQFICTNLDGCQKEPGNFLNLLQKEGVPRKRCRGVGVPSEKGGSNSGGNYDIKFTEIGHKIPNTGSFIVAPEFNEV